MFGVRFENLSKMLYVKINNKRGKMTYIAPVDKINDCLFNIIGIEKLFNSDAFLDFDNDILNQIIDEGAKFANNILAPTNRDGDKNGAKFDLHNKKVILPNFVHELNEKYSNAGWIGIKISQEYGGMGLPNVLGLALSEMFHSANMAFGLKPMLSAGTILAISKHGTPSQKNEFLPNLVSGNWSGTMNLTESGAGSDIGLLKTKAIPQNDGTYKIYGQKIFITWGDHDLNENIIHLVLARLPDAPKGVRGISLFIVPKYLKSSNGKYDKPNDVGAISIEHKLGIHLSPTCVMSYGDGIFGEETGAIGYLLGEENKGLACMFTMMNEARLDVGLQGVSIAQAAILHAINYAKERRQGRAIDETCEGASLIIKHPDIKRNLVEMEAKTQMARAICYKTAFSIDMAKIEPHNANYWHSLEGFLTPIAKAFSTDIGIDVASKGVQIHGGMGFIEETGAAQYYRDARICSIYEGTNAIQANDLIGRKTLSDNGKMAQDIAKEILDFCNQAIQNEAIQKNVKINFENLKSLANQMPILSKKIIDWQNGEKNNHALTNATIYLNIWGNLLGAYFIAQGIINKSNKNKNINQDEIIYNYIDSNILTLMLCQAQNFDILPLSIMEYDF